CSTCSRSTCATTRPTTRPRRTAATTSWSRRSRRRTPTEPRRRWPRSSRPSCAGPQRSGASPPRADRGRADAQSVEAELVALDVLHDDARLVLLVGEHDAHARRAERQEPVALRLERREALGTHEARAHPDVEVHAVLHDLALGDALEEQPRAGAGGVAAREPRVPLLGRERGVRVVPRGVPLGRRGRDVAQHLAPEPGDALGLRAVERDLDLPDRRRHRLTLPRTAPVVGPFSGSGTTGNQGRAGALRWSSAGVGGFPRRRCGGAPGAAAACRRSTRGRAASGTDSRRTGTAWPRRCSTARPPDASTFRTQPALGPSIETRWSTPSTSATATGVVTGRPETRPTTSSVAAWRGTPTPAAYRAASTRVHRRAAPPAPPPPDSAPLAAPRAGGAPPAPRPGAA